MREILIHLNVRILTCVPDLNSYGTAGFKGHGLRRKLNTDCRLLLPRQLALNISTQEVRLADTGVTKQDYFEDEVVIVIVSGVHYLFIKFILLMQ